MNFGIWRFYKIGKFKRKKQRPFHVLLGASNAAGNLRELSSPQRFQRKFPNFAMKQTPEAFNMQPILGIKTHGPNCNNRIVFEMNTFYMRLEVLLPGPILKVCLVRKYSALTFFRKNIFVRNCWKWHLFRGCKQVDAFFSTKCAPKKRTHISNV